MLALLTRKKRRKNPQVIIVFLFVQITKILGNIFLVKSTRDEQKNKVNKTRTWDDKYKKVP